MAGGIFLALYKDGKGYDITDLVQKIVWKGRKGAASRSISVTLIDDDGYGHDRAKINVMSGHTCIFKYNGKILIGNSKLQNFVILSVQILKQRLFFSHRPDLIFLGYVNPQFVHIYLVFYISILSLILQ